jgi:hypothetical protein
MLTGQSILITAEVVTQHLADFAHVGHDIKSCSVARAAHRILPGKKFVPRFGSAKRGTDKTCTAAARKGQTFIR